jgi:Putative transposase/Transposase zinc-binding domain
MSRPTLEVADVVRQYGDVFLERYGHQLNGTQLRALRAIEMCRTAALGGHVIQCDQCGHQEQSYNSCRNRHCPKCHGAAQATWLANRQREVLPTLYTHVISTLPHDLHPLVLENARVLYHLLFHTVSQSLLDIAGDPKHLGAELGGLAVLHTWGGQLHLHPHLHCLLPAGGLAPDGSRWVPCRPDFFLPVRVLSRRFRRLYIDGLKDLYGRGQLSLAGRCRELAEPKAWKRLLATLRDKEWVVYAKEPCDSKHVLKYLSRYVYRVAISNHRLVALEDGRVTFRYKDYKRGNQLRMCTLEAVEFLRRLMLHVLPKGLHKVRYFGLMANRHRSQKLAQCRTLLGQAAGTTQASEMSEPDPIQADEPAGVRVQPGDVCPVCGQGRMHLVKAYYRHWAAWDLSTAIPDMDTS